MIIIHHLQFLSLSRHFLRTKTLPKKVPAAGKSLFDSSTTTSSPSPEPKSSTGNKTSKQIPDIFAESSDDDDSDLFGSKVGKLRYIPFQLKLK